MPATEKILLQIKATVVPTDPVATLILFGSYARGDYREDTDIYLLVLLDKERTTINDRERIGYPLHHLEMETDTAINPILYTKHTWNTRLRITPFYKNVTKAGIYLWPKTTQNM